MMDLYAELGIDRSASRADVRKAYRKRAARAHPDAGGTREKFALVKRAHDVLSDPERRADYDQTGNADDKPPDNRLSNIMNTIAAALDMVLVDCRQAGANVEQTFMVQRITSKINDRKRELKQNKAAMAVGVKLYEKLVGRFTSAAPGENVMESMVRARLVEAQAQMARFDEMLAQADAAVAFLKDYGYRADKAEPRPTGVDWVQG